MTLREFRTLWQLGFRPAPLKSIANLRFMWKLDFGIGVMYAHIGLVALPIPRHDPPDADGFTGLYAGERHLPE